MGLSTLWAFGANTPAQTTGYAAQASLKFRLSLKFKAFQNLMNLRSLFRSLFLFSTFEAFPLLMETRCPHYTIEVHTLGQWYFLILFVVKEHWSPGRSWWRHLPEANGRTAKLLPAKVFSVRFAPNDRYPTMCYPTDHQLVWLWCLAFLAFMNFLLAMKRLLRQQRRKILEQPSTRMTVFQRFKINSIFRFDSLIVLFNVTEYCPCYFVGMEPEQSEVWNPNKARELVFGVIRCEFRHIGKAYDMELSPS